jgi:hypothetical protein
MGADRCAVDEVQRPVVPAFTVGLPLECRQHPTPDTGPLPAVEAGRDGLPGPIALGQGATGAAGAQDPEDAIEDGAVVPGRTTGAGFLQWEQGTKPLPLPVAQIVQFQAAKGKVRTSLRIRPSLSHLW